MDIEEQIEILTAHSDGKPLQCRGTDAHWRDHSGGIPYVQGNQLQWRIKPEEPKPKIADGHNPENLTGDDIGEGFRTLSVAEHKKLKADKGGECAVQYKTSAGWRNGNGQSELCTYRTKKPPGYFDSGVPMKRVALGPEDFPPGTVLREIGWPSFTWELVRAVGPTRVHYGADFKREYGAFTRTETQRSLDGGKTWLPCYKEVPETE